MEECGLDRGTDRWVRTVCAKVVSNNEPVET